jgi:hypothetical protein
MSISKFSPGETTPYPITPYEYDRYNYSDYSGFSKLLDLLKGGGYGGFDIREIDNLKTQYRPGVNSVEDLIKDPLFYPLRTNTDYIDWEFTGVEQSKETGIYWDYYTDPGTTASIVGNFEDILLYNAFLEAGDDYKTITIPKKSPEPVVEPTVVTPLVETTESKLSGEFTFNVEKEGTFVVVGNQNFTLKIGDLIIEGLTTSVTPEIESPKTIDLGDGILIIDDGESFGEDDIYEEESFQGSEELALQIENLTYLQSNSLDDSTPTSESTSRVEDDNINFDSSKYVGDTWKSFDINKLINLLPNEYKPKSKFNDSLRKVLYYIKNDKSIDDVRKAAYLLGTAFAESGYSLQRWEADYVCTGAGVKYGPDGPCNAALKYYRSTKGKKNYYTLGTDSKGFPYFGRGLIQLTGKSNYESYGKKIGVDLVGNGDLAIHDQNSYKIAVEYMKGRTFKYVLSGDLKQARKSVNGGTKGINEVNGAYKAWLEASDKYFNSIT